MSKLENLDKGSPHYLANKDDHTPKCRTNY